MIAIDRTLPLDIMLERLFDYAGMFPPASRSFAEALRESADLSSTLERPWLVACDLVLDTQHARNLLDIKLSDCDFKSYGFKSTLTICLLATEEHAEVINVAQRLSAPPPSGDINCRISSIEAKVTPASLTGTLAAFKDYTSTNQILLALEPDLSTDSWRSTLKETVREISMLGSNVALKCRCSGPAGIEAPTLAQAIIESADAKISLKVTGGLHHPIVDQARNPYPIGFLNLAAAVMFRRTLGAKAPLERLIELLQNSSMEAFSFASGLLFKDLQISKEQLLQARSQAHLSIGSCSLSEPDNDLIHYLY